MAFVFLLFLLFLPIDRGKSQTSITLAKSCQSFSERISTKLITILNNIPIVRHVSGWVNTRLSYRSVSLLIIYLLYFYIYILMYQDPLSKVTIANVITPLRSFSVNKVVYISVRKNDQAEN